MLKYLLIPTEICIRHWCKLFGCQAWAYWTWNVSPCYHLIRPKCKKDTFSDCKIWWGAGHLDLAKTQKRQPDFTKTQILRKDSMTSIYTSLNVLLISTKTHSNLIILCSLSLKFQISGGGQIWIISTVDIHIWQNTKEAPWHHTPPLISPISIIST